MTAHSKPTPVPTKLLSSVGAPTPQEAADRLKATELKALDVQIRRLDRATNAGSRQAAHDEIKKIVARPRQRAESAWRARALQETLDLARGRGEDVDIAPERGAACISNRDGFHGLIRPVQHLTPDQYRVGLDYRAGYERRGGDLKTSTIGDSYGGSHDNNAFVGVRFERAKLLAFVSRTERAVALGCAGHPSALQMLRCVAGQGHSLRAFGGGRALARNRDALKAALDVALQVAAAMRAEARAARAARVEAE